MLQLFPNTVRARLWAAIALLSSAVLGVSIATWIGLEQVDARMQELHKQSLSRVAQAIDLSKRSSDLATSAPYLLNQRSNFLIDQEGRKLIEVLDRVRENWPDATPDEDGTSLPIAPITDKLKRGVEDLISASKALDQVQGEIRQKIAKLGELRERAVVRLESPTIGNEAKLIWWVLQSMNADALNAAYANNLIGVGEEQRHFQRQKKQLVGASLTVAQQKFVRELVIVAMGLEGVFELRRQELAINLDAQNALFRIRRDANRVNDVAANYAERAEAFLAEERSQSSSSIRFIKLMVLLISLVSLALALAAALFVSRYVALNITRVSEAMVRLARGDRTSALPRTVGRDDEIGDLFRSFRSFRANALRLDRSNKQLDQRNALFEKVFANIAYGIVITDSSGRISAANPAFANILSMQDGQTINVPLVEWFLQGKFTESAEIKNLHIGLRGQIELTAEDGQILELRASKLPDDGRVWLIADVTESQNLANRLAQIDRIEALGKVAGDTAHDFANILATIKTHAHLLQSGVSKKQSPNLSAIENAVDFGSSLTERLLAFARKQNLAPEKIELNSLMEGMIEFVEIGLKDGVTLNLNYAAHPLYILADPGQLESTLLNLILNANNAISENGVIDVTLSSNPADAAQIVIKDNGCGMPSHVRVRAIEPFFSTRNAEGGTGLGLSIVYGFIKQSGGNFEIESEEGHGTTISLTLPIAMDDAPFQTAMNAQYALVVDDESQARNATQAILTQLNYQTTLCATASDAMTLIEQENFHLVLSDFDLGSEISGLEVLRSASQKSPDAMRLLMSGKSSLNSDETVAYCFIQKPITRAKLETALKNRLGIEK